jgi:ABC-type nickel/cobalt efflux system permease component RcnA
MAALMAVLVALIISCGFTCGFQAQAAEAPDGPKSLFGLTGAMQPQPAHETSYITRAMDAAWSILLFEQHRLTQNMTGAVRNLKSSTNLAAATGALVVASFIYGILHAAGPGHGKAVISSYMLADKETLRRGIFLAFLSSLIQALSAIVLVGGLYVAAVATGLQTKWAEAWLETLSWGFIALVGAWLLFRQIWPMVALRPAAAHEHDHSDHRHGKADHFHNHGDHVHEHEHAHQHEHHTHLEPASGSNPSAQSVHSCGHDHLHDHNHAHEHGHEHVHDEHCGHVHLPGPEELRGDFSWSRALAISFSIGIRPCTGALLVIIFAASQGMIWAGVLATFAMAFGTALMVSALAALSVGSRKLAIALAGAESRWGNFVAQSASILSSAAVFVLGTVFFFASFHDVRPF